MVDNLLIFQMKKFKSNKILSCLISQNYLPTEPTLETLFADSLLLKSLKPCINEVIYDKVYLTN